MLRLVGPKPLIVNTQACITMSSSLTIVDKPVEVITRELKLVYDDNPDDSTIVITGVEKESNKEIKMLLTSEFYLNMTKFDSEMILPEQTSTFSIMSASNHQYKLVKIMFHQEILIEHEVSKYFVRIFPRSPIHLFPQIFLEFDADAAKSSKDDKALFQSMIEQGFRNITAMLFESIDESGGTLQQYAFFNTEHCKMTDAEVEIVKVVLGCKADVDIKDRDSQSLLHIALKTRKQFNHYQKRGDQAVREALKDIDLHFLHPTVKCIETLVELQADINAVDRHNYTPLYLAVLHNNTELAKIILQKNPDVDIQSDDGDTALHRAVWHQNVEIFEILMERNANIHLEEKNGTTPLFYTLSNRIIDDENFTNKIRDQIMVTLLNRGANPNVKGELFGDVLLSSACLRNDLFAVNTILKYDVDVNFKNNHGLSPLHDVVRLKEFGRDYKVKTRLKYAEILIENGADVNSTDKMGETPLHSAAQVYDALPIVEILLENGALVNAKSKDGRTPLHNACKTRNLEMVETLLDYNADMTIRDNEGRTPLHFAAWGGYWTGIDDRETELQSIINLLKVAIDINDKDDEGRTPLHAACEHDELRIELEYVEEFLDNHGLIAFTLIKSGASVNAVDLRGKTPIYYAIEAGFFGILKVLINNGADINILDESNQSPLKKFFDEMNSNDEERLFPNGLVEDFLEHVVKLNYVKMYVCRQHLDIVFNSSIMDNTKWIEEYENSCAKELGWMKLEKIPSSHISYYDVLMEHIYDASQLINNIDFIQSLLSDELVEKFPIYGHVLRSRFTAFFDY